MVQYYNTGDKDSTNLIAYASDLSMFAMLFTDMQNGTRDYGNDRPIKSVEVAILFLSQPDTLLPVPKNNRYQLQHIRNKPQVFSVPDHVYHCHLLQILHHA